MIIELDDETLAYAIETATKEELSEAVIELYKVILWFRPRLQRADRVELDCRMNQLDRKESTN